MKVKDIMIRDIFYISKDDKVRTVLEKFAQHRISGMPIVDSSMRLVGYISDGDIMRFLGKHMNQSYNSWFSFIVQDYGYVVQESNDEQLQEDFDQIKENVLQLSNRKVQDVGVKNVITVQEDDDLVKVAEILAKRHIKKVPVVRNGTLVGIVSRGDVVRAVVQRFLANS